MRTLLAGVVFVAATAPAAAATCQSRKGDDGYWAWRQVDGKRCWYKGKRGMSKATLSWESKSKPRTVQPGAAVDVPNEIDLAADVEPRSVIFSETLPPALFLPDELRRLAFAPIDNVTEAILTQRQEPADDPESRTSGKAFPDVRKRLPPKATGSRRRPVTASGPGLSAHSSRSPACAVRDRLHFLSAP